MDLDSLMGGSSAQVGGAAMGSAAAAAAVDPFASSSDGGAADLMMGLKVSSMGGQGAASSGGVGSGFGDAGMGLGSGSADGGDIEMPTLPLLRHEMGGGLQVEFKFTRDLHVATSDKMTAVVLVLTNRRDHALRRIRCIKGSGVRAAIPDPLCAELGAGQSMECAAKIDFGGRARAVNLDIKTDQGSYGVSLEPPLGELFRPFTISDGDFLSFQTSLNGMNEGAVDFMLPPSAGEESVRQRVLSCANVAQISAQDGVRRFCGQTIAGGEKVLVEVSMSGGGAGGSLRVNCDSVMQCQSLLAFVKRSLVA